MTTKQTPAEARLRLFMSAEEAKQTVRRSTIGAELQIIPEAGSFYLKRLGRENVEPRFLCKDGRWRRYDLIPELPGSAAAVS